MPAIHQLPYSALVPRFHFDMCYITLVSSRSSGSSRPCETGRRQLMSSLTTDMLRDLAMGSNGIIVYSSTGQKSPDDDAPLGCRECRSRAPVYRGKLTSIQGLTDWQPHNRLNRMRVCMALAYTSVCLTREDIVVQVSEESSYAA